MRVESEGIMGEYEEEKKENLRYGGKGEEKRGGE